MPSRFSSLSNGARLLTLLGGTLGALTANLVTGCGSDGGSDGATAVDSSATTTTVVTGGGGTDAATTPGTGSNPLGDLPDSGSPSDAGEAADATVGTDGAAPDDATVAADTSGPVTDAAGGTDTGAQPPPVDSGPPLVCPAPTPLLCGDAGNCDIQNNTCCATQALAGRCIPGAKSACMKTEFPLHCRDACDCSVGESCCGVVIQAAGVVETVCQQIANGGICVPKQTMLEASEQVCTQDAECKNGQPCVKQTCAFGVQLTMCGVQSQDPFYCHAR